MSLSRFELELNANGPGRVVIDGVDISDRAAGVLVDARPGQPPRLVVELVGEGGIEGLGEALASSPASDLAEFFASIDPEELEKAALSRLGFGDSDATQAMLDILRDWAEGR